MAQWVKAYSDDTANLKSREAKAGIHCRNLEAGMNGDHRGAKLLTGSSSLA